MVLFSVWHVVGTQGGAGALKLLGPFSKVLDGVVRDPFVRNWLDLLCFLLSGAPLLPVLFD